MTAFIYHNPTRLVFGDSAVRIAMRQLVARFGSKARVVLLYGGGSVVRSGLLERVQKALDGKVGSQQTFGGVRPNPTIEWVRNVRDQIQDTGVDVIVAVGGGSVIDSAKALALAMVDTRVDPWDYFTGAVKVKGALPVYTILTIPAAGSEQSIRAVLSSGVLKLGLGADAIRPRVAAIDPKLFTTLPKGQIAAGVIDMMSHIMERYFSPSEHTEYVDGQAEAALRTAYQFGPQVWAHPDRVDLWEQIGLVGTFAHNGYFGLGRTEDWACHAMEHALSGLRPRVTHGVGLALIIPAWMRLVARYAPGRVVDFAVRVLGVDSSLRTTRILHEGLRRLKAFYQMMDVPTNWRRLEHMYPRMQPVGKDEWSAMAAQVTKNGPLGNYVPLTEAMVYRIYESLS